MLFAIGRVLGMLTRVRLATTESVFVHPGTCQHVFSMHGSMMLFRFAITTMAGIAVYLTPYILGTHDFALTQMTAYGYK